MPQFSNKSKGVLESLAYSFKGCRAHVENKKKRLTVVGRHGRYKPICIRYVVDL